MVKWAASGAGSIRSGVSFCNVMISRYSKEEEWNRLIENPFYDYLFYTPILPCFKELTVHHHHMTLQWTVAMTRLTPVSPHHVINGWSPLKYGPSLHHAVARCCAVLVPGVARCATTSPGPGPCVLPSCRRAPVGTTHTLHTQYHECELLSTGAVSLNTDNFGQDTTLTME